MGVAVVRGLLLGALAWILWDKLGVIGLASLPVTLLFLLFWSQESLLYVPRKGQYKQLPSSMKPLDNYEELTLVTMDGVKISAWFIKQHEIRVRSQRAGSGAPRVPKPCSAPSAGCRRKPSLPLTPCRPREPEPNRGRR